MKPRPSALLAILSVLSASLACSQGAVLGYWNFNEAPGGTGPTYLQSATLPTGVTASVVTASGFNDGNYGTGQTVSGVAGSRAYVFQMTNIGTTEAGALSGSGLGSGPDTFTFTLTPSSGYAVNLSQLSFYAWGNTGISAASFNFFVQTSLTSATLGTYTQAGSTTGVGIATTASPTAENNQYILNLSGVPELQNVTEPVTFTIGVYRTGTGGNLRFDELQIQGDVVPEPSGIALGALGLAAALVGRRRM